MPPRKLFIFSRMLLKGCLLLLCCLLTRPAVAAGSKRRDPSIAVRFHVQVNTFDPSFAARVTAGNPQRQLIVEKIPSLSERDIVGFYPFKSSDGTFAAAFQFDRHGSVILQSVSTENRGHSLVVAVNARPVALLSIDKIITDGIIYVPYGLTLEEVHKLGESFNLMGETEHDKEIKSAPKESTFSDPSSKPTAKP